MRMTRFRGLTVATSFVTNPIASRSGADLRPMALVQYAMVRARRGGEELLVTGCASCMPHSCVFVNADQLLRWKSAAGDQHIKLWRITGGKDEGIGVAVTLLATLGEQKDFAVLSLAVGENLALFAGYQGGFVKVRGHLSATRPVLRCRVARRCGISRRSRASRCSGRTTTTSCRSP